MWRRYGKNAERFICPGPPVTSTFTLSKHTFLCNLRRRQNNRENERSDFDFLIFNQVRHRCCVPNWVSHRQRPRRIPLRVVGHLHWIRISGNVPDRFSSYIVVSTEWKMNEERHSSENRYKRRVLCAENSPFTMRRTKAKTQLSNKTISSLCSDISMWYDGEICIC